MLIAEGVDDVVLSPHLLLAPCVALVLVMLALGGLADGMRRVLDPHGALGLDRVRSG